MHKAKKKTAMRNASAYLRVGIRVAGAEDGERKRRNRATISTFEWDNMDRKNRPESAVDKQH